MAFTLDSTTVLKVNGDTYDTYVGVPGDIGSAPAKGYPVLLYMHGTGANTWAKVLTDAQPTPISEVDDGNFSQDDGGADWPFIVWAPFLNPADLTPSWAIWQTDGAFTDIFNNAATFKIDVSQIYLCGLSLGGIGIHSMLVGWQPENSRWFEIEEGRVQGMFPASGSNFNLDAFPGIEDNAITYGRYIKIGGIYGRNDGNNWVTDSDHTAPWVINHKFQPLS